MSPTRQYSYSTPYCWYLKAFLLLTSVALLTNCSDKVTYVEIEKMVFASDRSGNWDVYLANPDGSDQEQLTTHESPDWEPSLAPDGRIAFMSLRDGSYEIFTMNIDGSDLKQLTHEPVHTNGRPEWSPDGSKIVFVSNRDVPQGGGSNIYLMNRDGSNQLNLTDSPTNQGGPKWSPTGSQIVFSNWVNGEHDLFLMNSDGSGFRTLTSSSAEDREPSWSPDGARIVFLSNRMDGSEVHQLYVMGNDGSDVTRLTDTSLIYGDEGPVWSPDGSKVMFTRREPSIGDILVMDQDGSNEVVVISDGSRNAFPDWKLVRVPANSTGSTVLGLGGDGY